MMGVMSAHSETQEDPNGEGEGVWSPEIEQAFQEALKLFPPCGRRKHILQEEGGGKMYGRNELIARYIEQKTGHRRTRKQVSSHIQVLSRREARCKANSRGGDTDSVSPASSITASSIGGSATDRILSRPDSAMSGGGGSGGGGYFGNPNSMITPMDIVASTNGLAQQQQQQQQTPQHNRHHNLAHHPLHNHYGNGNPHHLQPSHHPHQHPMGHLGGGNNNLNSSGGIHSAHVMNAFDFWEDRPIMTRKIRLVEFSAFVEQPKQTAAAAMNGGNSSRPAAAALSHAAAATQAAMLASLTAGGGGGGGGEFAHANGNGHLPVAHQPFSGADAGQLPPTNPHLSAQLAAYSHQHQHHQANPYSGGAHDLQTPGAGLHRHSYIRIDYRHLSERQANKLERVDIREIQDKFPDMSGPEGLFQRGPADSFFLIKFWADLDHDSDHLGLFEDQNAYFGFSSHFETALPLKDITVSTKACSYGNQVVEKVEKVNGTFNSANNTYSYAIHKSPMCEFMIQFIRKLRQLPDMPLMNRILENFTVLQLITSESSSDILMCMAFVFEIAPPRHTGAGAGSHYHVYKLTKD